MKRTSTSLIALGLVSVLAVACAQEASGDLVLTGGDGPSAPQVSDDPAAVAQRAVDDVTDFWHDTYPEVYGEEFQDLAGFYPYGPETEMPPCGPFELAYEEIADNAFYCPDDDIIAWDEGTLMPELNEEFGAFTVAIVIAHEYGHAAQARFGTPDRTVDLELQADCFAGAWTQRVASGEAEGFGPGDVDLDKTVAGMISIRDVPGTDPNEAMAHGSGFDRVGAFQDGYENGADKCAEYADPGVDRRTAELEFDDSELQTGGNFPLEDDWGGQGSQGLFSLVEQDLNDFYGVVLDRDGRRHSRRSTTWCRRPDHRRGRLRRRRASGDGLEYAAIYCEDENIVVLDGDGLGRPSTTSVTSPWPARSPSCGRWPRRRSSAWPTTTMRTLQADCMTGFWGSLDLSPTSKT